MTRYESWTDRGVGIVEVTGDLGPGESVALHAAIRSAVDHASTPNLVIVCTGIGRMALGPIGVVISCSEALRARGGRVALAGPDARIRRVLRIGGVVSIDTYADLSTALEAVGQAA